MTQEELDDVTDMLLSVLSQYYQDVIKIYNLSSAHTVAYPSLDFEQFDWVIRRIFEMSDSKDVPHTVFCRMNSELPL